MTATDETYSDVERRRRIVASLRPVRIWRLDLDDGEGGVIEFRWAGGSGVNVNLLDRADDGRLRYTDEVDYYNLAPVDQLDPGVEEVEQSIASYLAERTQFVLYGLDDA
jgi:hypothetical protein